MADQYQEQVVRPGDKASKLGSEINIASFRNCPAVEIIARQPGNFRGAVDFRWRDEVLLSMISRETNMTVQNDGAGGKPQFFTLIGTQEVFYGLGWEILVMCLDDIARSGGFPAVFANDLNVKRITEQNYPLVEALLRGFGDALAKCNVVNITGETAVMKHSITAFCDFNDLEQLIVTWGGTCIGLSREDKLIDGSKIRPGMPIVGFYEPGYRCNGGTVFTDIIQTRTGGDLKRLFRNSDLMNFVRKLTIPSVSYAHLLSTANGWLDNGDVIEAPIKMAGIAHITGGGVWGKLGDLLPAGCGAYLHQMPTPSGALLEAQELAWGLSSVHISDLAAYGTFHGGCGAMVVCETAADEQKLIEHAGAHNVIAYHIGEVTESPIQEIVIESRFKERRTLSSKELEK